MAIYRIRIRRDTALNWSTVNSVLGVGEMGFEIDTKKLKVGDGSTSWNLLEYINSDAGPHSQDISTINNLQDALDSKANLSHTHSILDITSLQTALDGKSNVGHSHYISDVVNLQSQLNSKSDVGHSHVISDVTGLQGALDAKSDLAHGHYANEVSGPGCSGSVVYNGEDGVLDGDCSFFYKEQAKTLYINNPSGSSSIVLGPTGLSIVSSNGYTWISDSETGGGFDIATSGVVTIGDAQNESNETKIVIDTPADTISIYANNGFTVNGADVWHSGNDGQYSGLDADLVHGISGEKLLSDISTGALYGGILSATIGGSTFNVSSGIGQIVSRDISSSGVFTSVLDVAWPTQSGIAVSNIGTHQFTYVYVDSSGTVSQQTTSFSDYQYKNSIVLGVLCHIDYSSINLVTNKQNVALQDNHRLLEFVGIFGPVKKTGLLISANQLNTMRIDRAEGSVFKIGSNYNSDIYEPDVLELSAKTPASLCRVYRDGSGDYVFDTNSGAYYSEIDPSSYDDGSGSLNTVNNNQWSIQRLYFFPNNPDDIICYYGTAIYNSYAAARDALFSEEFSEAPITAENAVFLGHLILRGGASDLSTVSDATFIQSGFFRGSSGGGAGGSATYAALDDLIDVNTSGVASGQALVYNGSYWGYGNAGSAGGGFSTDISSPSTGSLSEGYRWLDSETGIEFTLVDDGDGFQWVELPGSLGSSSGGSGGGTSVSGAYVNIDGNLIIDLTDSTQINAGYVIGPAGNLPYSPEIRRWFFS